MKKRIASALWMVLITILALVSCKNEPTIDFRLEPPLARLNPAFTTIAVNASVDSAYVLENGTTIRIAAGSLLDSLGNPLSGNTKIRYRQFDNAVSIFLAGLPMDYSYVSPNMALQTAGMFEIRGENQTLLINPEKPISITVGSNFTDPRQGFFKLNENNGQWGLIEIPEVKTNREVETLRKRIAQLKPEWTIPLGPNFYVFDYTRMADIFIGDDDWGKIRKANLKAMSQKMKGYGVNELGFSFYRTNVNYRGNIYDHSELLYKANKPINPPAWVKKVDTYYYSQKEKKSYQNVEIVKLSENRFEFRFNNKPLGTDTWSMSLEAVSHLRHLVKYSPEQLIARQTDIEKEIEETERKIRMSRMLEYTVDLYSMGIFNFDRPVHYSSYCPQLILKLNGSNIEFNEIKKLAVFNSDLSSVSYAQSMSPLVCPFFKGTNRMLLVTNDGRIGLLTAKEFDDLIAANENSGKPLVVPLTQIEIETEAQLMDKLRE